MDEKKKPRDRGGWIACGCGCGQRLRELDTRGRRRTRLLGHVTGPVVHGESHTACHGETVEYRAWWCMIQRCENPGNPSWKNYGGRGIKVCARWRTSYVVFLKDMGRRPSPHHSLGRIDNERGYTPSNVRWETLEQQARNKRTGNRRVTAFGKTMTVTEWSQETGIPFSCLYHRVTGLGWTAERALTERVGRYSRARP